MLNLYIILFYVKVKLIGAILKTIYNHRIRPVTEFLLEYVVGLEFLNWIGCTAMLRWLH